MLQALENLMTCDVERAIAAAAAAFAASELTNSLLRRCGTAKRAEDQRQLLKEVLAAYAETEMQRDASAASLALMIRRRGVQSH